MKNKPTAKILVLGGVALLLAFFFWPRAETLDGASKRIINAVLDGDSKTLLAYSWGRERDLLDLNEVKLDKFLHDVVLPNYAGGKRAGSVEVITEADQGFATASQVMMMPDGRQMPLTVNVVLTGSGVKGAVIAGPLFSSWSAKYYGKQPSVPATARKDYAWLCGIDSQAKKLESIGIKGVVTLNPKMPFRSWDVFRDRTVLVLRDRGFDPDAGNQKK